MTVTFVLSYYDHRKPLNKCCLKFTQKLNKKLVELVKKISSFDKPTVCSILLSTNSSNSEILIKRSHSATEEIQRKGSPLVRGHYETELHSLWLNLATRLSGNGQRPANSEIRLPSVLEPFPIAVNASEGQLFSRKSPWKEKEQARTRDAENTRVIFSVECPPNRWRAPGNSSSPPPPRIRERVFNPCWGCWNINRRLWIHNFAPPFPRGVFS